MSTTMRPCRNCGRCDVCLGLSAPPGMKVCRKCGEIRPVEQFLLRRDVNTRRNHCNTCRNGGQKTARCECGRRFIITTEGRTRCPQCRPPVTKPCGWCGATFVGSMEQRRYCSGACRDAAVEQQRAEQRHRLREEFVAAYGGRCACPSCPETNSAFLTLEHLNGDGRSHRAVVGSHAYADLRRRGWPKDGLTLLCWNCNAMTRYGRTCPHEK